MRVRSDNSTKVKITDNGGMTIGQGSNTEVPPADGLNVFGRTTLRDTTVASLANGSGGLVVGPESGENLVFDGNGILARNNGVAAPLFVGAEGGSPVNATDGHGLLIVGSKFAGNHISIDMDDIQSKSGNGVNQLWLNFYGGKVTIASPSARTLIRGDLMQGATKGGVLKAAVYITSCGGAVGASQAIDRQYNGVNSTAITATDNGAGRCIIHFPFAVSSRFWSAQTQATNGKRHATCYASGTMDLSCARINMVTGALSTGHVQVLVY
jgi:hypothetical protein